MTSVVCWLSKAKLLDLKGLVHVNKLTAKLLPIFTARRIADHAWRYNSDKPIMEGSIIVR